MIDLKKLRDELQKLANYWCDNWQEGLSPNDIMGIFDEAMIKTLHTLTHTLKIEMSNLQKTYFAVTHITWENDFSSLTKWRGLDKDGEDIMGEFEIMKKGETKND